jgi:hypothetical protein
MSEDQLKKKILSLAAQMVQCQGMPSPFREDWPKRLRWHEVEHRAFQAESKVRAWAMALRWIADQM